MTTTTSRRHPLRTRGGKRLSTTFLPLSLMWLTWACTTNNDYDQFYNDPGTDGGAPLGEPPTSSDAGEEPPPVETDSGDDDAGALPVSPGAPLATTDAKSLETRDSKAIQRQHPRTPDVELTYRSFRESSVRAVRADSGQLGASSRTQP